ncbi:MAG: hypothetical protein ACTJLK_03390 [Anaplasma sp.]
MYYGAELQDDAEMIGCKYASCTALVLASQAVGLSRIYGVPRCAEVLSVLEVLGLLGVRVVCEGGCYAVDGLGIGGLAKPRAEVRVGPSVFVTCLVLGLLAAHSFPVFLFRGLGGDAICRDIDDAEIGAVMKMLSQTGMRFISSGTPLPALVVGYEDCVPIFPSATISSNAVKTAMLLACLGIAGRSSIRVSSVLEKRTESLLRCFGSEISAISDRGGTIISVEGQKELLARDVHIFPTPRYNHVTAVVLS